jgi:hypothetical protein
MPNRKPYPSGVSDEEWAFMAPYLTLVREDAPQRTHDLREVFNPLRWIVRAGASWRMLPTISSVGGRLPADKEVDSCRGSEAMVHDLRALLRLHTRQPHATLSPESGHRARFE